MIKVFLSFFLILNFLYAENIQFIAQQKLLLKVKTIIQEEESIARAYESFIINEKRIPLTFSELKTDDYLGTSFSLTLFDTTVISIANFDFRKHITNRLKNTTLENDISIKHLYESDLFRKKTYYDNETISIKLKNEFAKHLYFLSSIGRFDLIECGVLPKRKYCIKDDDIYIYQENSQTNLLMYYAIEKFNKGPIIITKDTSLHITSDEFNHIPKGAILYDTEAVKYIKTRSSIEVVK
jgi:hypothetical protein